MNSDESSPEISNDAVANVSRNPLTNLRTLFKRKTSAINLDGRGGSFGRVLIVFSVLLNLIFLWLVISLGNTLFVMKETLAEGLLEGVASSLALSENAQIETIININEQSLWFLIWCCRVIRWQCSSSRRASITLASVFVLQIYLSMPRHRSHSRGGGAAHHTRSHGAC